MNSTTRNGLIAALVLIVIIVAVVMYGKAPTGTNGVITANYSCNAGKTIGAVFNTDKKNVALTLSDGRTMTLQQTISADGARYSDGDPTIAGDESFVFWSKGNAALVLEDNEEKSYIGCVTVVADTGVLPQVYSSASAGFSIRYPAGFTVTDPYTYTNLGPGRDISGVKFTVPPATVTGTNLSSDTYISVETLPGAINSCSAEAFLDQPVSAGFVDDGDTRYSVATAMGAGAGNRYEETVYATPVTNGCLAVRYYIHYGVIQNYPDDGSVTEFNKAGLIAQFDAIRKTLTHI